MKPKNFDELIKSKFDDNEFAYDPAQWEKVAERLDERPGKRKSVIWLSLTAFATLGSVAASLAMVFSVASFLHHKEAPVAVVAQPHVQPAGINNTKPVQAFVYDVPHVTNDDVVAAGKETAVHSNPVKVNNEMVAATAPIVPQAFTPSATDTRKEADAAPKPYYTFNTYELPEKEKASRATIISIAGGVNYGSLLSGYSAGVSGKKMIGDHFYVEGDVAFVSNSATQRNDYATTRGSLAKVSTTPGNLNEPVAGSQGTATQQTNNNLYYAQVSPSIGYHLHKNFSVGVGADVQKLMDDSKTVTNGSSDVTGVKDAAPYDFGFIAKTECGLSKKVKAGIYYRQGMNSTIMPGANYIDRSYLQVQIKYAIFNK